MILDGLAMSQRAQSFQVKNKDVLLEEISKTCPRISELDVSRNLFECWSEVSYICNQLHYLRSLRLEWVQPSYPALGIPAQNLNDNEVETNTTFLVAIA